MAIPKELQSRYDRCVKKVMANGGKVQAEAQSICELSLTSMKPAPKDKPKPEMVVANVEKDTHFVFSSNSKINAENNGTVIKNIEIFKAGTFKGIEFKLSALEKMVANFYVLKSHGIFDHVPVRSDHPGWLGEVGVIDRVGGYVKDLRVVGKKLVADIRVTSQSMLDKIKEGSYVQRSAEIGHYRDNNGDVWTPCLWGFAWVDIPAVEGLSPTFSFSQDKNVELVKLNSEDMHVEKHGAETAPVEEPAITPAVTAAESTETVVETVVEEGEKKDAVEEAGQAPSLADEPADAPVAEAVDEKEEVETSGEEAETVAEAPVEESTTDTPAEDVTEAPVDVPEVKLSLNDATEKFAKEFPEQFKELQKLKKEKIDGIIQSLVTNGRILPAQKDKMSAFVKDLSDTQLVELSAIFNEMPAILKLNEEAVETASQEEPENGEGAVDENAKAEKNADEFLEKTK